MKIFRKDFEDKKYIMEYKKIILKSCHQEEYPDLEIICRVLQKEEIGEYLRNIPEEKKFIGTKIAPVAARRGVVGEKVDTVLKTVIDGREYILSEESGVVKERDGLVDIVVTNVSSTSNEEYIVKAAKFAKTYNADGSGYYIPARDPRVLTEVPENLIIMTAWGSEAICLQGSYIVTYSEEECDYNTLERGAKESTYEVTPINGQAKVLRK